MGVSPNSLWQNPRGVRAAMLLAGFEKVPLLGGQNVPLGFVFTGGAEIVPGVVLG